MMFAMICWYNKFIPKIIFKTYYNLFAVVFFYFLLWFSLFVCFKVLAVGVESR